MLSRSPPPCPTAASAGAPSLEGEQTVPNVGKNSERRRRSLAGKGPRRRASSSAATAIKLNQRNSELNTGEDVHNSSVIKDRPIRPGGNQCRSTRRQRAKSLSAPAGYTAQMPLT